jgi:hypothetical protein
VDTLKSLRENNSGGEGKFQKGRKRFFFEKKEAKNFYPLESRPQPGLQQGKVLGLA